MARYTEDSIDRVRDAIDMVDLVGTKTDLRRAGVARFEGLCPFHDERTPSFGIDPLKKLYHCFGCGAGGDGIKFVRETEGLDFVGAIEWLADRYGVNLEVAEEDPEEARRRARRERLLALLDRTASYYERVLWESPEAAAARDYLSSRGLTPDSLRAFRVGYSPSAWDRVLLASRRAGFSNEELYETGLATRGREGRLYDRFRGRIMFPLANARGQVVGFGARAMGDERGAKYINTPESPLFHKRDMVYAGHLARAAAAKAREVIVCEGYTDVIAMHQAGFANCVATMGTALTEAQVRQLKVLAPVARLAMDADTAGQEAMLRAAEVAGDELQLLVPSLPPGLDPADLVHDDPSRLGPLLADAEPIRLFMTDRLLAKADLDSAPGRDAALRELAPVYAKMTTIERSDALGRISSRVDLPADVAERLLRQYRNAAPPPVPRRRAEPDASAAAPTEASTGAPRAVSRELSAAEEVERTFLAQCLALPGPGREALDRIDLDEHLTDPLHRRLAEHIRTHGATAVDAAPSGDEELRAALIELNARATQSRTTAASLAAQRLYLELRRVERRMRAARAAGEPVSHWAQEKQRVKAELEDADTRSVESA
ncbi:MAG TPA: DNA primase [Solirubrobacteraceae bacterium]|jgi:DNA primase